MSVLVETSQDIALKLSEAGVKTHAFLPARITPPVAVVSAGSPFVSNGDSFGSFTTRWVVTLVTPTAANEVATNSLYELIEDAIVTLANSKYVVEQVSKPYALEANNAQYAAVDLNIYNNVRI